MSFYREKKFNEIAKEVVRLMPTMAAFYSCEENLIEYSKRINCYEPHETHLYRQKAFKEKIVEKINRIFNQDELKNINLNIDGKQGLIGGVVEHHGIMDHPLLLSVALISNYYKLFSKNKTGDILTFATGNVPLNEPFRKRGIILNGKKINIFSKEDQHKVVYGLEKMEIDILSLAKMNGQWEKFSEPEQKFLNEMNENIRKIDFSSCKYLGEQFTKINYDLWPHLFSEELRGNLANLFSLENDDLVADYLINILSNESNCYIYRMLFDKRFQNTVLKEFEGSAGAWDEKKGTGTHFFWGISEKNEKVRLALKGGCLQNNGENIKIKFDQENIINALGEKKLLPGIMLKFSIFIFYLGIKPLAGYSLEYLVRIRGKIAKVIESEFPDEAKLVEKMPLDNMNLISIMKGRDERKNLIDKHAFDIFFEKGFSRDYFEKLNAVQFKDLMIPSLKFALDYAVDKYGQKDSKKNFSISEEELQAPLSSIF